MANGTPSGNLSNQRLVAAGARAIEDHARVRRFADRLCEELDHVTSPHGIPVTDLDPEDSMVIAVEKMLASQPAVIPMPRTSTKLGIAVMPKTTTKGR